MIENTQAAEIVFPQKGIITDVLDEMLPSDRACWMTNFVIRTKGQGDVRYGFQKVDIDKDVEIEHLDVHISKLWETPFDKNILIGYGCYFNPITQYEHAFTLNDEGNEITIFAEIEAIDVEDIVPGSIVKLVFQKADEVIKDWETYQSGELFVTDCEKYDDGNVTITFSNTIINSPDYLNNYLLTQLQVATGSYFTYNIQDKSLVRLPTLEKVEYPTSPQSVVVDKEMIIVDGVNQNIKVSKRGRRVEGVGLTTFIKLQTDENPPVNIAAVRKSANAVELSDHETFRSWWEDIKSIKYKQIVLRGNIYNVNNITITTGFNDKIQVRISVRETIPTDILTFKEVYIKLPDIIFTRAYVHNNFLLATPKGGVSSNSNTNREMRIYYIKNPGDINSFFSTRKRKSISLDISTIHGVVDETQNISALGNHIIFFGRKKTQIWQATVDNNAGLQLSFERILNVGLAHPDLIWRCGGKVYFVDYDGIKFISTQNWEAKPVVESVEGIGADIKSLIKEISLDNSRFLKSGACQSSVRGCTFLSFGETGRFYIKHNNKIEYYGYFDGLFDSNNPICELDNKLYVAKDGDLYLYTDGVSGVDPIYTDGGKPITAIICGNFKPGHETRRWMNYKVRVDTSFPLKFQDNPNNKLYLKVFQNNERQLFIEKQIINLQSKGYEIQREDNSVVITLRNSYSRTYYSLMKFLASSFLWEIRVITDSDFSLKRVIFVGRYQYAN